MKWFWIIGAGLVLLSGCASIKPPTSHIDILEEHRQMSVRLDRIAEPLLKAGMGLCFNKKPNTGLGFHTLFDFPKEFQPVAKTHWQMNEDEQVFYVREGSAAHKAGLKRGDTPSEDTLRALGESEWVCEFGTQVRIQPNKNAFANGHDIIVTTSLMRAIDDLALSLIAAHELAHNVLGIDADKTDIERELEADRWAVFLLARAGLDYGKAIRKFSAITPPHSVRTNFHDVQKARFAAFRKAASEVKALQKSGKPLEP